MRVLHVGSLDSIHLRHWAELTDELGHDVTVAGHLRTGFTAAVMPAPVRVAPQLPWASTRRAERTGRRVDRVLASLPNAAVEVPLAAAWMRRLLKRVRPDLIHTHMLPHWGAAAALAGGRPLVAGALGDDIYVMRGLRRRLSDLALARSDFVVAPAPHAVEVLTARAGRPGRVVHLERGIDLEAFSPPAAGEREAARARLGLSAGPVVLSFRATSPVYGLPLVAESFRRLFARRPDAQLLMVHGPSPLDRSTAGILSPLGSAVRVVGQASPEEMRECFHAADVGVSVPSSDGSPNSVWEALACATPVVCSDLPQIRERLGDDAGVAFAAREPDAVAEALDAVIAAPDRDLGAAGRRWCEANVDRRDSLRRVDAFYRRVVAGSEAEGSLPQACPEAT